MFRFFTYVYNHQLTRLVHFDRFSVYVVNLFQNYPRICLQNCRDQLEARAVLVAERRAGVVCNIKDRKLYSAFSRFLSNNYKSMWLIVKRIYFRSKKKTKCFSFTIKLFLIRTKKVGQQFELNYLFCNLVILFYFSIKKVFLSKLDVFIILSWVFF